MNSKPAFPHSYKIPEPERPLTIGDTKTFHGLSMRDWFAGQALSSRGLYGANVRAKEVAEECYAIADAMLEARKEK